jgi:hypothetical protein
MWRYWQSYVELDRRKRLLSARKFYRLEYMGECFRFFGE